MQAPAANQPPILLEYRSCFIERFTDPVTRRLALWGIFCSTIAFLQLLLQAMMHTGSSVADTPVSLFLLLVTVGGCICTIGSLLDPRGGPLPWLALTVTLLNMLLLVSLLLLKTIYRFTGVDLFVFPLW